MGNTPDITNDIDIEVTDVTGAGPNDLPVTSVRTVKNRVRVENGQTFGIGGLTTHSKQTDKNRIPILGDIPFIGYLFGRTSDEWDEMEVVILITPHALIDAREFQDL
jgi:type II secretory pathway component GspD/PulD (secretin)